MAREQVRLLHLPLPILLFVFASYLDAWPGGDRHGGPQRRRARKDSTRGKHACCFLLVELCVLCGKRREEIIMRSLRFPATSLSSLPWTTRCRPFFLLLTKQRKLMKGHGSTPGLDNGGEWHPPRRRHKRAQAFMLFGSS
jgi:hypothetical protein